MLDHPNDRSSHTTPTPRGGGLAVISTFIIGVLLGATLSLIQYRYAITLGLGVLALGMVGWIDDARSLRPAVRLAIHVVVATWTTYMLGGFPALQFGSVALALGPIGSLLAILAIVWSINLFNFMDGIDGLAASQAVLIFTTVAALLWMRGDNSLALLAAIAAAASAGFLAWNWPPARIFLGDVGSGPIGYLIAAIALASENRGSVPLLAIVIIYGVFICDASVTLVRRFRRGSRLTQAHRDHAYQRLTRAWGSHKLVTIWTAGVTGLLAVIATLGVTNERLLLPSLVGAALLLTALLIAVERRAPL
jgi:Fuc2NAc and GlcNAc transferase